MFRWVRIWLILILAGFTGSVAAQDIEAQDLEAFIDETMSASRTPGLAVIIFDRNGVVYENGFGIADSDKRPVTLDTPFQLGSVSKSFAALLMVQLAAEGRIDLDAPVTKYLPDFRTHGQLGWRDITVRHLLSHRSGFATLDGNRIQENDYRGADALALAVKRLEKAKLNAIPGVQYEYSNANYMIAAAIIEKVTGQPFETVMDDRIFKPLGMINSYVQIPNGKSAKEATGFRQWFGISIAFPNVAGRAYVAAGGVTASARDLAVYMRAVANRDPRIVPARFADQLISPMGDHKKNHDGFDYGLGWMLNKIDGKKVVFHSGLNGGYAAHAAYFPGDRSGGVVLINQSGALQADVPGAVLRKGLGVPTGPSKPSAGQHFLIWGMVSTVAALLIASILSTIRFSAYAKSVNRVNPVRRALPALALFALAYGLAFIVPNMNAITLGGIRVFYPDLWLTLSVSAAISVIWGVTRLIYPRGPSAN